VRQVRLFSLGAVLVLACSDRSAMPAAGARTIAVTSRAAMLAHCASNGFATVALEEAQAKVRAATHYADDPARRPSCGNRNQGGKGCRTMFDPSPFQPREGLDAG
jgi:hypothetical protein